MHGLKRIYSLQKQLLVFRHRTAHYHTVIHRVNHRNGILTENIFNKKITAKPFGVIAARILRTGSIPHLIICLHCSYLFRLFFSAVISAVPFLC